MSSHTTQHLRRRILKGIAVGAIATLGIGAVRRQNPLEADGYFPQYLKLSSVPTSPEIPSDAGIADVGTNADLEASPMDELWLTLEQWLGQHLPEVLADLNPGCSSEALEQLEHQLGCSLPADFKACYQHHNGQKGATTGLFCGLPFLSIEALYSQWLGWQELAEDFSQEAAEYGGENLALEITGDSYPDQSIKPTYINLKWIPISEDGGGNHLGVDLDPGTVGVVGQVINFGRDENNKFVLAPSLTDFVAWMIGEYAQGNYLSSQRSLNLQEPENSHFLDVVPVLFGRHD